MTISDLAKIAYDAYCGTRGWKSYDDKPLPQWPDVREDIKTGWMAAAMAVMTANKSSRTILIRPTRPEERFNDQDLYIAWFQGDAAGSMAATEEAAITKLVSEFTIVKKSIAEFTD